MFYDEDGDLAHEFYEEVKINSDSQLTSMKKKLVNLRPQVYQVLLLLIVLNSLTNIFLFLKFRAQSTTQIQDFM